MERNRFVPMNKCPACQSEIFYLKDPDDEYEIFEFALRRGEMNFLENEGSKDLPPLRDETQIFCNRCAWHGRKIDLE
jgi:hypothetical protein